MKRILILLIACGCAFAAEPEPTPEPTPFPAFESSRGEVVGFENGAWLIAPDEGGIVIVAGDETPANIEADIAADDLRRAQVVKRQEIDAAYAAAIDAGATVSGEVYGITPTDQANWVAALAALDAVQGAMAFDPAEADATALLGPLLNQAGEPVGSVTVTEFRGTMVAIIAQIGALRAAYMAALGAIAAATTPSEVNAVTFE